MSLHVFPADLVTGSAPSAMSHVVTLPACEVGEVRHVYFLSHKGGAIGLPAGWTRNVLDSVGLARLSVLWRAKEEGDPDEITFTIATTPAAAWWAACVWENTTAGIGPHATTGGSGTLATRPAIASGYQDGAASVATIASDAPVLFGISGGWYSLWNVLGEASCAVWVQLDLPGPGADAYEMTLSEAAGWQQTRYRLNPVPPV